MVFGAGTIAARRVAALAKTPCRLTVIAPECGEGMQALLDQWQDRISYVKDRYRPGCLMEEDMDAVRQSIENSLDQVREIYGRTPKIEKK